MPEIDESEFYIWIVCSLHQGNLVKNLNSFQVIIVVVTSLFQVSDLFKTIKNYFHGIKIEVKALDCCKILKVFTFNLVVSDCHIHYLIWYHTLLCSCSFLPFF